MSALRIALVGLGKIARDQHVPAVRDNRRFTLAATVDPFASGIEGVAHFENIESLFDEGPVLDAMAICTPPQQRHATAAAAIGRGLHVLLEKPPCATVEEVEQLERLAEISGVTLFAAWHSRFAAGVAPARAWLAERRILSGRIIWREDVRRWHPKQSWIWQDGGFGVFDPGINALSIVTHIVPQPLHVERARSTIPANRAAPIAADVILADTFGAHIAVDFDWREAGQQVWAITIETDSGPIQLREGGAVLDVDRHQERGSDCEYSALYAHFVGLIGLRRSDVDVAPLRLAIDAISRGDRDIGEAFID